MFLEGYPRRPDFAASPDAPPLLPIASVAVGITFARFACGRQIDAQQNRERLTAKRKETAMFLTDDDTEAIRKLVEEDADAVRRARQGGGVRRIGD